MSKQNPNELALERCRKIEAQLAALAKFVAGHKKLAVKNAIQNWGYVGDLGHIEEKLRELTTTFGGAQ